VTPTFIRFEGAAWLLYLRYGRLLVLAGWYATRTEALRIASTIDGLPV
jgi:hypothetical protein